MPIHSKMFGNILPSSRKRAIAQEGGSSRVVQNEYEKAVSTGRYTDTLENFAKSRGMRMPKKR